MTIAITMPALSPTMEEGAIARWLVKAGERVKAGDVLAEIETDKASMEFEAADPGVIARIEVQAGTEGVKVGTVIAYLAEEGEDAPTVSSEPAEFSAPAPAPVAPVSAVSANPTVKASPLARRLATQRGIDLASLKGSGPRGRIVRSDIEGPLSDRGGQSAGADTPARPPLLSPAETPAWALEIPHEAAKLSNVRKTIARRLTESKQQIPHIYLTVDVRLDALMELRAQLNASLSARGIKLSVNDLMVKAQALALMRAPACNVMFAPGQLISFRRVDISVAVSTPTGLITPVIRGADSKSLSVISAEISELAARARENKLTPSDYTGGTASISNMGMYGIKQFEAIINPPQAMILAVGAGERRPYVMEDDTLGVATVMSATGSFDHRAIDGADAAAFMSAFKALVEDPLGLLV